MRTMHEPGARREFEFLCVDDFIQEVVSARALTSALELNLIDLLLDRQQIDLHALPEILRVEPKGLQFLLELLRANRVIHIREGTVRISSAFLTALKYRDLLEAKLDFANMLLPDFHGLFTRMLRNPLEFMGRSRVFELFRYDRCYESNPENVELTQRWMRFTTALTKYEAQACLKYFDFGSHRKLLDVGGNSGEFVLRVCKTHPELEAAVYDLPVVCEIGEKHVASEPEAKRIQFIQGDARKYPLPQGFDLISFKSILHDWQPPDARLMLSRAVQVLQPGGRILIFERGPVEIRDTPLPFHMIPNMLFMYFYRAPRIYTEWLKELGLMDIQVQRIELEMPFYLLTAQKGN
ncbi:MAG: methyltransferase [bacterium]|jgi:ubiquinone/menaquinone biosynthesis C-methylase UbiE